MWFIFFLQSLILYKKFPFILHAPDVTYFIVVFHICRILKQSFIKLVWFLLGGEIKLFPYFADIDKKKVFEDGFRGKCCTGKVVGNPRLICRRITLFVTITSWIMHLYTITESTWKQSGKLFELKTVRSATYLTNLFNVVNSRTTDTGRVLRFAQPLSLWLTRIY